MIPRYLRLTLVVFVLAVAAILVFPFRSGSAQKNNQTPAVLTERLPNYDAFGASPKRRATTTNAMRTEARLGVPTFLWASDAERGPALSLSTLQNQANGKGNGIESVARDHLGRFASSYRLTTEDVTNVRASSVHDTGKGPIIVKFPTTTAHQRKFRSTSFKRQRQRVFHHRSIPPTWAKV